MSARGFRPRIPCAGLLLLLLIGCDADDRNGHARKKRPSRDHLVTVFTAERKPVAAYHEHLGSMRFRRLMRIHSQEEGRVIELPVFSRVIESRGGPCWSRSKTICYAPSSTRPGH